MNQEKLDKILSDLRDACLDSDNPEKDVTINVSQVCSPDYPDHTSAPPRRPREVVITVDLEYVGDGINDHECPIARSKWCHFVCGALRGHPRCPKRSGFMDTTGRARKDCPLRNPDGVRLVGR